MLSPFDGGQFRGTGNSKQRPIRLAALERYKKLPMRLWHLADDFSDKSLAGGDQSSRETGWSVIPSKPRRNSSEISLRVGARTSDIGRSWLIR